MARLGSIFHVGLVVVMVVAGTTSQWVDDTWHSENRATEWKYGYRQPEYRQWPWETNRPQQERKATEWKNGQKENSGHLVWKNGRWDWSYGNSELEAQAENWRNSNSQPGYGYRPTEDRWQIEQQAKQWQNGAGRWVY